MNEAKVDEIRAWLLKALHDLQFDKRRQVCYTRDRPDKAGC